MVFFYFYPLCQLLFTKGKGFKVYGFYWITSIRQIWQEVNHLPDAFD